MIIKEALELLETAPTGESLSKVNPSLTQGQSVTIIRKGILSYLDENDEDYVLSDIYEKRVYQVVRNQRRPRY